MARQARSLASSSIALKLLFYIHQISVFQSVDVLVACRGGRINTTVLMGCHDWHKARMSYCCRVLPVHPGLNFSSKYNAKALDLSLPYLNTVISL